MMNPDCSKQSMWIPSKRNDNGLKIQLFFTFPTRKDEGTKEMLSATSTRRRWSHFHFFGGQVEADHSLEQPANVFGLPKFGFLQPSIDTLGVNSCFIRSSKQDTKTPRTTEGYDHPNPQSTTLPTNNPPAFHEFGRQLRN